MNPALPRKAKDRADPRTLDMFEPRRIPPPSAPPPIPKPAPTERPRPARGRRKPGPPAAAPEPVPGTAAPPGPAPPAEPPPLSPDERAELARLRLRAEEAEREYQDGRELIESIEAYLAEESAKAEALESENDTLRQTLGEWADRVHELEREREQLVGILISVLDDRRRRARKQPAPG